MREFQYRAPRTIREAVGLLAEQGERARPLAGGTDLLVQMRLGLLKLDMVVDVKRIPELGCLSYSPEAGLVIGAAVTCAELGEHPDVRGNYPGLWDAVGIIGGSAIQGRATVGGNLCNAAPSGDSIPALIVLGATARIDGPQGTRLMPVADFCLGPRYTVLEKGEMLVSLQVPAPQPNSGAHYVRFTPRAEMDIAVAGAGAWVRLNPAHDRIEDARVALSAVAPTPLYVGEAGAALIGRTPDGDAIAEASRLARQGARPIDDLRGGMSQRKHLVEVLVKRALRGAIERAKGEGRHV